MTTPKHPLTHTGQDPYSPVNVFFVRTRGILTTLYERWQDEKEYEDIKDYAAPIQRAFDRHGPAKVQQMHARPFGCTFIWRRKTWRYTVTAKKITLQQVKKS